MGVRLSAYGLSPTQLDRLQAAWAHMQDLTDDRGFGHFAGLHGLPFPIHCKHSPRDGVDLLFLPWHRAYLYFFERALQDIDGDVSIPWWDWTSDRAHSEGLPPLLDDRETSGGDENPFLGSVVDWEPNLRRAVRAAIPGLITAAGRTLRDPEAPDELPRAATMNNILQATTFSDFSNRLENVHGAFHVWMGGAMSQVPAAAYDPVFWVHHCTVDRYWYLWQMSDVGRDPPDEMMDLVLDPFPITVREVLTIQNLGYEYAVQQVEGV